MATVGTMSYRVLSLFCYRYYTSLRVCESVSEKESGKEAKRHTFFVLSVRYHKNVTIMFEVLFAKDPYVQHLLLHVQ